MFKFLLWGAALSMPLLSLSSAGTAQSEVPYTVVQQGDYSGVKKQGYTVIRTQGALEAFLKKHNELGAAPYQGIDWKTDELIVIYGGEHSTTGYAVGVQRITARNPNEMVIEARLTSPGPGAIINPAITTPFAIIRTAVHKGRLTLTWVNQEPLANVRATTTVTLDALRRMDM